MKHRSLFLLLILVFRVCVVLIGFARYAAALQHVNVNYEQIRIKKRRSSFLEEGAHTFEAVSWASSVYVNVKQLFPFVGAVATIVTSSFTALSSLKYHFTTPVIRCYLYLFNRALRI